MPENHDQDSVSVDRISVGMKVMGGILLHAVMLVVFFMKLQGAGEKNAESIQRNTEHIATVESDVKLAVASINAQIATINVRLAVLENQNAQKQQQR